MPSPTGFESVTARLSRVLSVDQATFFAVGGRAWSMAAGLVTTAMIASFFSPELQGYYYTFNSLLALQVFAELGLGAVLVSFASHEWAKLSLDSRNEVVGDADALSRLASLAQFSSKWYLIGGAIATAILIAGGFFFFLHSGASDVSWGIPWILLCILTGVGLLAVPALSLLEGCNQVRVVYGCRLMQLVIASVVGWLSIYLGGGLWTASITTAAGLGVMVMVLGSRYRRFLRAVFVDRPSGARLNWRADILPMQWRIAVSWAGGYLAFFLFTPVLFQYHGAVVAGQMGMTWAFINALMSVVAAITAPKAPRFGMLVAQANFAELDRVFWRVMAVVVGVAVMGSIGIWGIVLALNEINHPFANRLLPPSTTAFLLLATVMVSASLPMSAYLRAHKKEPLMALSLASGVLTCVAVVTLGKPYGANGVAIGYLVVMSVTMPAVAIVWSRMRLVWHSSQPVRENSLKESELTANSSEGSN